MSLGASCCPSLVARNVRLYKRLNCAKAACFLVKKSKGIAWSFCIDMSVVYLLSLLSESSMSRSTSRIASRRLVPFLSGCVDLLVLVRLGIVFVSTFCNGMRLAKMGG